MGDIHRAKCQALTIATLTHSPYAEKLHNFLKWIHDPSDHREKPQARSYREAFLGDGDGSGGGRKLLQLLVGQRHALRVVGGAVGRQAQGEVRHGDKLCVLELLGTTRGKRSGSCRPPPPPPPPPPPHHHRMT